MVGRVGLACLLKIYKIEVLSPISCAAQGLAKRGIGVRLEDPPLSVDQWYADRCFAGFGEGVLRHLYNEYSLPLPADISEEDCGPEDLQVALAVDLTCKFDPKATEEKITAEVTSNRFKGSVFDDTPDLDLDWLKDNSLEKDVKEISEYVKQHDETKNKAKKDIEMFTTHVKTRYEKSSKAKGAEAESERGAQVRRRRVQHIAFTMPFRSRQPFSLGRPFRPRHLYSQTIRMAVGELRLSHQVRRRVLAGLGLEPRRLQLPLASGFGERALPKDMGPCHPNW